ncbi:MAG TPA: condensation domain-containing protein [Streptosporangiaceae bacterium]
MITLFARDPLVVTYEGGRDAEGPLSIGQLNILRWLEDLPRNYGWEKGVLDVPAGAAVEDVGAALAALVARHEGLRTYYDVTGPEPVQRVRASGEVTVELYELGPEHDPDALPVAELRQRLRECLYGRPTPDQREVQMRIAVATRGDLAITGVVQYSHLAVDYFAVALLEREFAEMMRDPAARLRGPARHQPLDQAQADRTPRLRRRAAAALEQWESGLRAAPQCAYPAAAGAAGTGGTAAAELRSEAAAMALANAANRTGLSRPTIVMAAMSAVLGHRTGAPTVTFMALSANRFDSMLSDYIGSLVQSVLISLDVDDTGFDALARRAWHATLRSARYGTYDVDQRTGIADRVQRERGVHFSFEPLFNNRVADTMSSRSPADSPAKYSPEEIGAALPRTSLNWSIRVTTDVLMLFDLQQVDEVVRLRLRTWHPDRLPEEEIERLLLAVERVLVAAGAGDLDAGRLDAAIGLGAIPRDDDWILLDACWIQLSEVRRLVDDALAPARARVFAAAGDRRLVAYLAADGHVRTPEQAHALCMAALPGRFTAMTPRHYVLCAGAPDDVTDLAAWRRLEVLAEGSGRDGDAQ